MDREDATLKKEAFWYLSAFIDLGYNKFIFFSWRLDPDSVFIWGSDPDPGHHHPDMQPLCFMWDGTPNFYIYSNKQRDKNYLNKDFITDKEEQTQ